MDKIFLIGHRGVGKSTLIDSLYQKSKNYICFDLDQEVESRKNVTIQDLFQKGRVSFFRNLELEVLSEIVKEFDSKNKKLKKTLVVALGAGLELEKWSAPKQAMILWLRRSIDANGRIFSDRPALTKNKNPLHEWEEIFSVREERYRRHSTAQVIIPEYNNPHFNPLFEYLNFKAPLNGYVTLLPNENDQILIDKKSKCNVELRTDLLSEKEIFNFFKTKRTGRYIIALRGQMTSSLKAFHLLKKKNKVLIDWDLALGWPSKEQLKFIDIYSTHSQEPVLDMILLDDYLKLMGFKKQNLEYKICPEVTSHQEALDFEKVLEQVMKGLSYSYLPRGILDLSLSYHRQFKSYQQKIGFFKFGEGSSQDQPLWWQWPKQKPKGFYGILGQNIKHSYTPSFHFDFFQRKNLWPLSIESFDGFFKYTDYFKKNLLKALAVTSPYKNEAYHFISSQKKPKVFNPKTSQLKTLVKDLSTYQSANTLAFATDIDGFNTDFVGLKDYLESHLNLNEPVFIWGGGALLEQLKLLCPKGLFYSAQTGEIRSGFESQGTVLQETNKLPLIWASGEKGSVPDHLKEHFVVTKIIDLDYRENSKAKLYSSLNSIQYVNGLEFFVKQAIAQQEIWETYKF